MKPGSQDSSCTASSSSSWCAATEDARVRQTVMVLRMIVIGVLVDVQRRDPAGGRGQEQSEPNCKWKMHPSECM